MRILRPARKAHAPQGRMCTELSRPLSPQLTTHLRSQDFDADHVTADRSGAAALASAHVAALDTPDLNILDKLNAIILSYYFNKLKPNLPII